MHINPDHYLETEKGRILSPERNQKAWRQCFLALQEALSSKTIKNTYLLIGCQASGKSTWAKQHLLQYPNDLIFDAILVKKSERKAILHQINATHLPCIAVWFQTPLEMCFVRNSLRPLNEQVNVQGLRNVYNALEAPCLDEGFHAILIIKPSITETCKS